MQQCNVVAGGDEALATRTWFVGSSVGSWRVLRVDPVSGLPLAWISRLEVTEEEAQQPIGGWVLTGVTSFERYVTRAERSLLEGRQESLGRPSATRAALIPIRKSAAWWDLPHDERRAILEERSHHIRTGIEYLPAVAGDSTTVAISASPSTSSPGSSMCRTTRLPSSSSWSVYGVPRNGATLSGKLMSA